MSRELKPGRKAHGKRHIFFGSGEFHLPKLEENVLEFWRTNQIFEKSLEKTKKGKPFTFYDGPPFATGLPHYGHILASTIKDVIPRYQTMRGRFVRRRWGWDCHGLPIEEIVERKLGISGKKQIEKIGIGKFNETCRNTVLAYAAEWKRMIERIARWVEFDDSYKTMNADYMESVWWGFKQAYKQGLVYEGRKVLLYCPRCETPVSNFEVAMDDNYEEVAEEAVTAKFKLKSGQRIASDFTTDDKTYVLSWTTTPWTLPGNVALAVGEDIVYAVREKNGETLIVAEDSPLGKELGSMRKTVRGQDLVGLSYDPLFEIKSLRENKNSHKIYAADFVNTEEGTGVVHTAVVYGEDDYELGLKTGLPVVPLLDEKGVFNEKAPAFIRGKYFKDAEKFIKDDLAKRNLLFDRKMHTHSYPHCWRCGNVLFYNAIPAWFLNIQKIKKPLLASNAKEINWFPTHLKHGRYEKSVEQAPDWNISRNRYWGNPIPVWKCEKCGKAEVVGSIKELSDRSGGARNEYWVMRHGHSEALLAGVIDSGQGKYHLTPTGEKQTHAAAKRLRKEKINLLISSDVLRTKETAAIVAKELGIKKIIFDKRIREINLAGFSGKHPKAYWKEFPTYESRFVGRPEGGESLRDVRGRMRQFLEEVERKYSGKRILMISHEYPIWMFMHTAEGMSEGEATRDKESRGINYIEPGEVRKVEVRVVPRDGTGLADFHRPYIDEITFPCAKCRVSRDPAKRGKGVMRRTREIFDSWTEAGSMPFAEYHYPFENKKIFESRFPAQFVAEYIAQTRAWFYVMHVVSLILFKRAPFENVVTTGTILAEDGAKMSKSRGNFPDPWEVINRYGVDSLRFYLMNSVVMQADNLNFSVKGLQNVHQKVFLILWNVYNYFATYAEGWRSRGAHTVRKTLLDLWINDRTNELVGIVTRSLDIYDTVRATRAIEEYVSDLSRWYLRRSRKRRDRAFFETLQDCLLTTSKVIAPFMPYLAELLYYGVSSSLSASSKQQSVHLTDWPKADKKLIDKKLFDAMAEIRRIASLALAKRAELGIKVRQPLALLNLKSQISNLKSQKELLNILADEINVKKIVLDPKLKDEIEFDTTITPELKEEGIVREFVRMAQELRAKAGFEPRDTIALFLEVPEILRGILQRNEKLLKKEVGAKSVEHKKSAKFDAEISTKFEDSDVWIGVRKVK